MYLSTVSNLTICHVESNQSLGMGSVTLLWPSRPAQDVSWKATLPTELLSLICYLPHLKELFETYWQLTASISDQYFHCLKELNTDSTASHMVPGNEQVLNSVCGINWTHTTPCTCLNTSLWRYEGLKACFYICKAIPKCKSKYCLLERRQIQKIKNIEKSLTKSLF